MDIVFSGLILAATVSLVLALGSFVTAPTRRRLDRLASPAAAPEAGRGRETLIPDRQKSGPGRFLAWLGQRRTDDPDDASFALRRRLVYAGFRSRTAPAVYLGLRLCLALGLPLLALAFPRVWQLQQPVLLGVLFGGAAAGYVAPSVVLDRLVHRRRRRIQNALPDALDLMVVCVEAGFAINASLARVAEEFAISNPDLSQEFELAVLEARAGKSTTEALRRLADRTGISDLSALTALLIQTERFGTSVADALRVHADAMRVRRMQRAEERAQKAPLKLIFPSLLIFAAVLMIFALPGIAALRDAFPD